MLVYSKSMSKGNPHNYKHVVKYLQQKSIDYVEYNAGTHLKILGATAAIELWPSQMTYHILKSENSIRAGEYNKLDFYFNENQLGNLLNESGI